MEVMWLEVRFKKTRWSGSRKCTNEVHLVFLVMNWHPSLFLQLSVAGNIFKPLIGLHVWNKSCWNSASRFLWCLWMAYRWEEACPDVDLQVAFKSSTSKPNNCRHLEKVLIAQEAKEEESEDRVLFVLVLNHLKGMELGQEFVFQKKSVVQMFTHASESLLLFSHWPPPSLEKWRENSVYSWWLQVRQQELAKWLFRGKLVNTVLNQCEVWESVNVNVTTQTFHGTANNRRKAICE